MDRDNRIVVIKNMLIRIAIVEDQEKTLEGLTILLNNAETLKVVGGFISGEDALKEIPGIKPDVALIDLGLPGISGIDVIRELKEYLPSLEIIVFTIQEDRRYLFSALKAGASGYLLKDVSPGEIIGAIEEIRNGGAPMSPKVARYVIEYFQERPSQRYREDTLTEREREILQGIVDGITNRRLADRLFISPHTVRTHIRNIYEKLHVHSKVEAVMRARERGIV